MRRFRHGRRWHRYHTGRSLYRSRQGVVFGVCRGLADHFNFNVFWIRVIFVIIFIFSGFWPVVGLYLLAALIIKPEPVRPIETKDEQDFYDSYVTSRERAVREIKRRYENLDRRIRRMEDAVTGPEFDWDKKFKS